MMSGSLLHSLDESSSTLDYSSVNSLAVSPEELLLAICSSQGKLSFFDLQSFDLITTIQSVPEIGILSLIQFDSTGSTLNLFGSEGFQIWSWEPVGLLELVKFPWGTLLHSDEVFDTKSAFLIASHSGSLLRFWLFYDNVRILRQSFLPPNFLIFCIELT